MYNPDAYFFPPSDPWNSGNDILLHLRWRHLKYHFMQFSVISLSREQPKQVFIIPLGDAPILTNWRTDFQSTERTKTSLWFCCQNRGIFEDEYNGMPMPVYTNESLMNCVLLVQFITEISDAFIWCTVTYIKLLLCVPVCASMWVEVGWLRRIWGVRGVCTHPYYLLLLIRLRSWP